MTITYELDLQSFEAWSGAKSTLERIQNEGKCDELECLLEELYPDGMTETQLNDLLRFDSEWIYENLGIRSYDKVNEELKEAKEELADLESDLEEELDDEGLIQEERKEIIESYEDDLNEIRERIAELEDELKEL